MNRYKLVIDPETNSDDSSWIAAPNNGGDIGGLPEIVDELNKLMSERDALLCACPVHHTTMWRGKNCDVPSCPECGKMRIHSPENR